ncbi:MAG: nuclear transport factor 2 family protein [Flavobacteriaceae bacterium]|nr:nuclear transport factor 2 family protein [Flavobacteriaceae bacterium]
MILKIFLRLSLFALSTIASAQGLDSMDEIPKYEPVDLEIHTTIVKLDSIYFSAYNTCDMKTQALFYSENLEFFHDKGGLSTSKQELLKSIEKNICGKVTRTLIKGSIEVYPIHNYGAVEIGYHKFFNKQEPNAKSVPSKFIIIWQHKNDTWKITKVISLH